MPNEIYHRSEWGNPKAEGFGDVYFDASATNKLYKHSDNYENSDGTDKILRDIPNKASIVLTPTAYSDGSLNTVIPPYQVLPTELVTNGDFSDGTNNWTLDDASNGSISVVDGKLEIVSNGGAGYPVVKQGISTSIGKKYSVTFSVTNNTTGFWFRVSQFESHLSGDTTFYANDKTSSINFKGEFTAISTTSYLKIFAEQNDAGSFQIDDISIKEIQEADFDFSRGSSATRVNEKGLIEDVASNIPRIDYTSGFGSLLLEPQRTNLITYSEDFSEWSKTGSTSVSLNDNVSPDGTQNASTVSGLTGSGSNDLYLITGQNPASKTYSLSVYLKGEGTLRLQISNNVNQGLSENVTLTSDWKRHIVTGTFNSTSGTLSATLDDSGATATQYKIWGAQLEEGSYATSYIPTSGSTVTRSADVANNSGNADLFNDSEGVLYAELEFVDDATSRLISINDNSASNRILFGNFSDGNFKVFSQSSDLIVVSGLTGNNKIAAKYKSADFSLFVNGVEVGTSTSTILPTGLSELSFDNGSGGSIFYGNVKSVAVFKEALTDAELESLTSWVSFTEMATDLEYTLE